MLKITFTNDMAAVLLSFRKQVGAIMKNIVKLRPIKAGPCTIQYVHKSITS